MTTELASAKNNNSQRILGIVQATISIAFFVAIFWFIDTHSQEIAEVAIAFRHGSWLWLIAALLIESVYFYFASWYFQTTLALAGIALSRMTVLQNFLASQAVGVVTPTEFIAVQGLFVNQARLQNLSRSQAWVGVILAQASELYSFALLIIFAAIFLVSSHSLARYETISFI